MFNPCRGVAQVLGDECRQAQAFIQLAYQNETGIGGDARPLERDLQKAIEGELKGLGFVIQGVTLRSMAPYVGAPEIKARRPGPDGRVPWPNRKSGSKSSLTTDPVDSLSLRFDDTESRGETNTVYVGDDGPPGLRWEGR